MRKKVYATILFLLVITSEVVFGKETSKSKSYKVNNKRNHNKEKSNIERIKRSIDDKEDKPFWANRGKKKIEVPNNRYESDIEKATKFLKKDYYSDEEPFWGMRGRRESESIEDSIDYEYQDEHTVCEDCYGTVHYEKSNNVKERRQDVTEPFWGNRGRRGSKDTDDINDPFWGNRGRRQDNEPFWGTRGRRKPSSFWSSAKHEEEPFWRNQGIPEDDPFWGNRGRRQESDPFWGNRGRRQDSEPFWGSRGRRDDEPFWGNRGRRKQDEFINSNPNNRKEALKQYIMNAISLVEHNIDHLSRLKRSDQTSFWSNRGRDSKLQNLFHSPTKTRFMPLELGREFNMDLKVEPNTVHDSRIFAEEPHFILVERSSRSSGETEDPFFISRGKKYYLNYNVMKAARDRRGAIEEIVKSVRNDPYYIARGKKDTEITAKTQSKLNSTSLAEYLKTKELICSAVDIITNPNQSDKVKREIDNERERRTMLKKLAAQLQIDPYYVSRGKKNDDNLKDCLIFICHCQILG